MKSHLQLSGWCGAGAMILLVGGGGVFNTLIKPAAGRQEELLSILGQTAGQPLAVIFFLALAAVAPLSIAALRGWKGLLEQAAPSALANLAFVFGSAAFVLLEAMLIVQTTVNLRLGRMFLSVGNAEKPAVVQLYRGLRSVDLGLDLAWDVFIAVAVFLFAWLMLRNRRFGKCLGVSGVVIAVALLGLNAATVPTPPGNAGLVDIGPLLFLWILFVNIRLIWAAGKIPTEGGRP